MTLNEPSPLLAQQTPAPDPAPPRDDSPAARMARRWPQPVKVGALVGLPMLDDDDRTLGFVKQVVKGQRGDIKLIVAYNRAFGWFGWFTRAVAVPIEVVAIFGRQIGSIDMQPERYEAAPTWVEGDDTRLGENETIRIALMRR
jgi:hypothetical protein